MSVAKSDVDAIFEELAAPIDPREIRERQGQGGRMLRYITAETVMRRLDEAVGPANWDAEIEMADRHVKCRLSVHLPGERVVVREGIGGYPESGGAYELSAEDKPKGGATDAFKRAGVLFGIGRELYEDALPNAAGGARPPARDDRPSQARPAPTGGGHGNAPRSGRALFAWTKEQGERHKIDLLKYLNGWAKFQDFPGRMVDWDAEQVAAAYAEGCRKLQAAGPAPREPGSDDEPPPYTQPY